mmetsp:Transcript_2712/g.2989  ORF Transcript_2712/g.2989 Transcript_2712/m.2989 type:complete len:218 (+) Transcript_2712:2-655(+)|eukprot:CAMPEP_0198263618 /NCGR_PEP_ID=MMETSP1447-20131203/12849_1 /TAXON_ID=420782 /ORGANISM="Chaetoceros dichaeta, Strain CCMP1751" /LENGTH=217 /DNA_ID=CAMNT_0043952297 /DNA_START=68 /DNA_END=721 /DNA_ORIENTATION=+
MKLYTAIPIVVSSIFVSTVTAFVPGSSSTSVSFVGSTALNANIRGPTDKSEELRFGWDGTNALGGAVEVAKSSRLLEDIRAGGETIPEACELFNANLEMGGDDITFEEVTELLDEHYESALCEFQNGGLTNKPGENQGSANVLSYAALSNLDDESTLKLWGQYYRDVKNTPSGTDHQNIRNFIKSGWNGVKFEFGISLTRKNTGDNEWDLDAESWIP